MLLRTHSEDACKGHYCCIHNPSDHHMLDWPVNWREDLGVMERICPHGIGHPDPDDADHKRRIGAEELTVHGCDGCCTPQQNKNMKNNIEELKGLVADLDALFKNPQPGISTWILSVKGHCHLLMKALNIESGDSERGRTIAILKVEFDYWAGMQPSNDNAGICIGALGGIANTMGAILQDVSAERYKEIVKDRISQY